MTTDNRPAHSPIGASTCERWWECPGSVALIATLPDSNTGTFYSAEGTVAHMLVERQSRHLMALARGEVSTYDLLDELGRTYVEDDFEIEVKEEMLDAVEVYINCIQGYLDEYGLSWAHDVKVEVKFDLTHIDPDAFGTCDTYIMVPMNRLIIVDFKYGAGYAVEVYENKQFLYYGLGAYYDAPVSDRLEVCYLETVVVQPRARHSEGPIRRHVYGIEYLRTHELNLRNAVGRVRSMDPTRKAGPHCKFCPAKPVCNTFRDHVQGVASLDFAQIETAPVFLPEPVTLQPERLAQLMRNADIIRDWCSSILSYGHRLAETGVNIPGYKLVERKANRRWINEQTVIDNYTEEFGEKLYKRSLISPAGLEKLLKTKRKTEIESLYETPPAGKVLVPVEDSRPIVHSDAQSDFEAFIPA